LQQLIDAMTAGAAARTIRRPLHAGLDRAARFGNMDLWPISIPLPAAWAARAG
jgi:hypothetical protein